MADILKVLLVFVFIVFLLRRRLGVGYVMLAGAGGLAALYMMNPKEIALASKAALTSAVTLKLAVVLMSIRVFELVLREQNALKRMMAAATALLRSKRAVIVSMPLLIGMLPSVGGAYFSAPMVEEATRSTRMPPEEKAFVNYWFRHPWEYVLPTYPGIVLASAIAGVELWRLIMANSAYAAMVVLTGLALSMKGVGKKKGGGKGATKRDLLSFTPIAALIALVVVLRVQVHWALLISVAGLFLYYRYSPRKAMSAIRRSFSLDFLILIAGVMLFKEVMEVSGAVQNMSRYFTEAGVPLMPILLVLPFITGVLTGLTIGFVGATFPLIMSLLPDAPLWAVSFAFGSGFLGVLLSPVHVCLILTREYFKADMWGIYRRMLPAGAAVLIVAAAQYLIMS